MMPNSEQVRDTGVMAAFKGSSALRGLESRKISLALVQAACAMSLEGTGRATATEITARAAKDYGIEATPSFTGQTFANLDIPTVTSHGKNRFILEHKHLEEIRKDIVSECEGLTSQIESALKEFQELPARINDLRSRWQAVLDMRAKERQLISLINQDRQTPSRLPYLEGEANKIKQRTAYIEKLEEEIEVLSEKVKSQPKLEERKKALEAATEKYEAERDEIAARGRQLDQWINALQPRKGWVSLATLEQAIATSKQKLEEVNREISRRRSFLDKLLHRDEDKA